MLRGERSSAPEFFRVLDQIENRESAAARCKLSEKLSFPIPKKKASIRIQQHQLARISLRPSHCFRSSSDSTTTSRFFSLNPACLRRTGPLFGFLLLFLPSPLHHPLCTLLSATSGERQWLECAVAPTCPKRNYIISHAKWAASAGHGRHPPYIQNKQNLLAP